MLVSRATAFAGLDRFLAISIVATAGLLFVHVVPLALGILSMGAVLVACLAFLSAAILVSRRAGAGTPRRPAGGRWTAQVLAEGWPGWLGMSAAVAVAIFAIVLVQNQATIPSASADYANFHLPNVARWIQTGSLWQIDNFLPAVAPGNYPNNGDVMLLAVVLPWDNDFLAHAPMWTFFLLTGVSVYHLTRLAGAARGAALSAAAIVVSLPAVTVPAIAAGITDAMALFGFTAGCSFLVRYARTGARPDFLLAGLSLGISFGTKWYSVSTVAIVIAVWVLACLVSGRGAMRAGRSAAALGALVFAGGGIWLVRNFVESSNPVFPVKVAPLGATIFDAPPDLVREAGGRTILDYVLEPSVWANEILPRYEDALGISVLILALGSLWLAARIAVGLDSDRLRMAGLVCGALLVVVYAITPYSAGGPEGLPQLVGPNSRYLVPALIVVAAVLASAASGKRRVAIAWGTACLAGVAHGIYNSGTGSLGLVDLGIGEVAAGLAVGGVLALGAYAGSRLATRLDKKTRRTAIGGLGAVAVLAGSLAGFVIQERFNDQRYVGADPVVSIVAQVMESPVRVGLAGVWTDSGISPILPAFGPRLENEVEYVGPVFREFQQRYTSRHAFVDAVDRGGFDFLIVGRGRPGLPTPPELIWADSAAWSLLAQSDRLRIYAVSSEAS
jgi:hypothetical protein